MEMTGEYRIAAPREKVWEGLNDPEILRQSIPGCESLTKESDTGFSAKVQAKVGPVKAKFAGSVTLSDLNPPESYTISGEGKGGAAGFAKGGATVRLTTLEDGQTLLAYEVKANVGGKLAQIGSRLIAGSAKKMADEFFGNFSRIVASEDSAEDGATLTPATEAEAAPQAAAETSSAAKAPAVPASDASDSAQPSRGLPPIIWIGGLVLIVGLLIFALM